MNRKIKQKLAARKRRIERRLDKTRYEADSPVISASNVRYEISDRTHAMAAGGFGMIHQMVKQLELDQAINRGLPSFKF